MTRKNLNRVMFSDQSLQRCLADLGRKGGGGGTPGASWQSRRTMSKSHPRIQTQDRTVRYMRQSYELKRILKSHDVRKYV